MFLHIQFSKKTIVYICKWDPLSGSNEKKAIPKKECVLAGGCNVNSLQIKRKRTGMNLASVLDLDRGVFCIDKIENSETGRAKICYGSANNLNLASVEQINHKIAI